MKRADLTTAIILGAVAEHRLRAWEALTEVYPPKLVRAALYRENATGNLDYGVCVERSFLTSNGLTRLCDGVTGTPGDVT